MTPDLARLTAHRERRERWWADAAPLVVAALDNGASVGQVARALGVSKPTLYAHCAAARGRSRYRPVRRGGRHD